MNSMLNALKNKITGTSVVDNAANPVSAYSRMVRKNAGAGAPPLRQARKFTALKP